MCLLTHTPRSRDPAASSNTQPVVENPCSSPPARWTACEARTSACPRCNGGGCGKACLRRPHQACLQRPRLVARSASCTAHILRTKAGRWSCLRWRLPPGGSADAIQHRSRAQMLMQTGVADRCTRCSLSWHNHRPCYHEPACVRVLAEPMRRWRSPVALGGAPQRWQFWRAKTCRSIVQIRGSVFAAWETVGYGVNPVVGEGFCKPAPPCGTFSARPKILTQRKAFEAV